MPQVFVDPRQDFRRSLELLAQQAKPPTAPPVLDGAGTTPARQAPGAFDPKTFDGSDDAWERAIEASAPK